MRAVLQVTKIQALRSTIEHLQLTALEIISCAASLVGSKSAGVFQDCNQSFNAGINIQLVSRQC